MAAGRARAVKRVAAGLAALALLAGLLVVALVFCPADSAPPATAGPYSTEVLDRHGELLRLYTTPAGDWRLPLDLQQLDPRYLDMLLAYEDQRFYQHHGVDFIALGRAVWQLLSHGRVVSGASTISMQSVRLLRPQPRSLLVKLGEMLRAWRLERQLDKAAILRLYLERAPYGGNLQGVRAASLFYFGKSPRRLSLAQAALLVALPQSPEARRPDRHPQRARQARDAVLERLAAQGIISVGDARRAAAEPVPTRRRPTPMLAPHLADAERRRQPGAQIIRTSLDATLQARLEQQLRQRQGGLAPGVTVAALLIDNASGEVRAWAGSGDYLGRGFPGQVDMVRAVRSPGSALKPFIYGLAFEQGMLHPETLIIDQPGAIKGYAPGNFDRRYQGEMSVREALTRSRNLPAVRVLDRVGPRRFASRLRSAGVTLRLPGRVQRPSLAMALGGVGVTLHELVGLYAAIANRGELRALSSHAGDAARPTPGAAPTRLLSAASAWYLTWILSGSEPPPGYAQAADPVAFKTGTSYGFRDAWAIGFNSDYTIGSWVGRPDGGYTPGLTGRSAAVPVLFDLFGLLPERGVNALLRQRPASALLVDNSELPPALRRFDSIAHRRQTQAGPMSIPGQRGPRIAFPPAGSVVETGTAVDTILIQAQGGELPLHWLVNGRYATTTTTKRRFAWRPEQDGQTEVSVIDGKGRAARVRFVVAGPE